jgi:hypothetical protein
MQLTKAQRKNLELYAAYRSNTPTIWRLFRQNLVRYLVIAALIMLLNILSPSVGMESIALIFIGLFLGTLFRDVGTIWRFVRIWPATAAVLDWERLDTLLDDSNSLTTETY